MNVPDSFLSNLLDKLSLDPRGAVQICQHLPKASVISSRLLDLLVYELSYIVVTESDAPKFIRRQLLNLYFVIVGVGLDMVLLLQVFNLHLHLYFLHMIRMIAVGNSAGINFLSLYTRNIFNDFVILC